MDEAIEDFDAGYDTQVSELARARDDLSTWLAGWAAGDAVREDLLLVLDELLANAIAAGADEPGTVAVHAHGESDGIVLVVTNPSPAGTVDARGCDHGDALRGRGRGLIVVESLVDDLAITLPDGDRPLRVWCRRRTPVVLRPDERWRDFLADCVAHSRSGVA